MPTNYYPMFLDLSHTGCLVLGAGRVGRRKAHGLAACNPARLLLIDPAPLDPGDPLAGLPGLEYAQRPFRPNDLAGMGLAFACSSSREANRALAALCRAEGVWCNVADAPEESDFYVPAKLCRGSLTVAVSTGGASPALARAIKHDLEQWLDKGYARLVMVLEKLRPQVLALGLGSDEDAEIFRALCAQPARENLLRALTAENTGRTGNKEAACALLQHLLPPALHPCLPEILDELD